MNQDQNKLEREMAGAVEPHAKLFADRVSDWVDLYLIAHPLHISPFTWARAARFFLVLCLGAFSYSIFQHLRGDTFRAGYQAREIEQFNRTHTEDSLKVQSVAGQRVLLQPVNILGEEIGKPFVRKFCDGMAIQWQPGEVVSYTYESDPKGDGGKGCEILNKPQQLGFSTSRDPKTLESINLEELNEQRR